MSNYINEIVMTLIQADGSRPNPDDVPPKGGLILCLSGGGLRATYFHVGVILALRAMKKLNNITHVFSVSGGSITAGFLATNWKAFSSEDDEKAFDAVRSIIALAGWNIRREVTSWWLLGLLWVIPATLNRFQSIPERWRWGRTDLLQRQYHRLFGRNTIDDITDVGFPIFHFLSTSLMDGSLRDFSAEGLRKNGLILECDNISIAKLVAASSAFPPLFPPVRLHHTETGSTVQQFGGYLNDYLTDGGVFDNTGFCAACEKAGRIIISDAGGEFDLPANREFQFLFLRSLRATDILMKRVSDEVRNRVTGRDVTTVQIGTVVYDDQFKKYSLSDYPMKGTIEKSLVRIRTDLDNFNNKEVNSLIIHGARVCYDSFKNELDRPYKLDLAFIGSDRLNEIEEINRAARRRIQIGFLPSILGIVTGCLYLGVVIWIADSGFQSFSEMIRTVLYKLFH